MRKFSIFLVILLCSCATQRVELFNKRIEAYWQAMRWRSPEALAAYVEPPHREQYLGRIAGKLQTIRLVDHAVLNVTFDEDKQNALCRVAYNYYTLKDNELLSAQEMQHWRYHDKEGWQLKVEDRANPE